MKTNMVNNSTNTITSHLNSLNMKIPWDKHKDVTGLNRLMGSQPSPLDNGIYDDNTYINKR